MTARVYGYFQLFNMRIVNMQHLWVPSNEYKGQATTKPNYFITAITPKTRAQWHEEPAFASAVAAYMDVLNKSGRQPGHIAEWPIKDGDTSPEPGKGPSEWARGHWVLGGSTSSPIKVEIVQSNGNIQPLPAKVGVKPGDYVALGLSAAIKANNAAGMKHYCNTVLFMAPGEEIVVGNGVTGEELMRQAQQAGLTVQGFGAPGGMGGFGQQPMQGGFQPTMQPGFGGAPAAGPFGGAPMGAPVTGTAPGPTAWGGAGYPSSGGAPAAGPFGAQQPGNGAFGGAMQPGHAQPSGYPSNGAPQQQQGGFGQQQFGGQPPSNFPGR